MSRRSIFHDRARRLEALAFDAPGGRAETGGRVLHVEFYEQARDSTLIRLPNSDGGDDGEAARTIRVVFVHTDPDGSREPGPR